MLDTNTSTDTMYFTEDNRVGKVAIGHLESLGGGVDNMVNSLQREVPGHELDDGV